MNSTTPLTGTENGPLAMRQVNYYVDGALGSDTNTGTMESPFKTIQRAINASDESVNAGENHIFVRPGQYNEALSINDNDLLTIDGTGANPWDVFINSTSGGMGSATIDINGGFQVRLSDMWITGNRIGVEATNLGALHMENVFSARNAMMGLRAFNVVDVDLLNSRFFENGAEGFRGGNITDFLSQSSVFNDNQFTGVNLFGVQQTRFETSNALRNGVAEDAMAGVNGIDLQDVQMLHVVAGSYNRNFGEGIKGVNITNLTLNGVTGFDNGQNGVLVQRTLNMTSNGGNFSSNGSSGFDISDPMFAIYPAYTDPTQLQIVGGLFASNMAHGIVSRRMDEVHMEGVTVRTNMSQGVNVATATSFQAFGGFIFQNSLNGIQLAAVSQSHVEGVIARENMQTGLFIRGGVNHEILGGGYVFNNQRGIHIIGGPENFISTVMSQNVASRNNMEGFKAEYVSTINVTNGDYSFNTAHGLSLINFTESNFNYVNATNNTGSGARLNIGRFAFVTGQENVNRVNFLGGNFNENSFDGITVSTLYDRTTASNELEFSTQFTSARRNGRTGLNLIDDRPASETVKQNYARIDVHTSFFINNGMDGVFVFAGDQAAQPLALIASFNEAFANDNGRYGLRANATVMPDLAQDFTPEGDAYFSVTNSDFINNGQDGLRLRFSGVLPNAQTATFASFREIDALDNGGHGMIINAAIDWAQSTMVTLQPKIIVSDSRFNNNILNGLQIKFARNNPLQLGQLAEAVDVQLNNVTAVVNRKTGLNFGSTLPAGFTATTDPNLEVNGGRFNDNFGDGMYIENTNNLRINNTDIIANQDDGLQLDNVADAEFSTAFIADNGDNNVETS